MANFTWEMARVKCDWQVICKKITFSAENTTDKFHFFRLGRQFVQPIGHFTGLDVRWCYWLSFFWCLPTLVDWTFSLKQKKAHKFHGLFRKIYAFHRHNKAIYLHNYTIVLQYVWVCSFSTQASRFEHKNNNKMRNQHMFK